MILIEVLKATGAKFDRFAKARSKRGKSFASVLVVQVVTALLGVLIASGRCGFIPSSTVVSTLLFIQIQTLGLTIAKLGLDQIAFSSAASDHQTTLKLRSTILVVVMPIAVAWSVWAATLFGAYAAIFLGCSVVLDTYSLIKISELNGKEKYRASIGSSFLNYSFFYSLFIIVSFIQEVDVVDAAGLFLLSSSARFIFVFRCAAEDEVAVGKSVILRASLLVALQQGLNYWLFRGDQVLMAMLKNYNARGNGGLTPESYHQYLYMAKMPELMSSLLVLAGSFIFTYIFISGRRTARVELLNIISKYNKAILLGLTIVFICFLIYCQFYASGSVNPLTVLGFLVQCALILPVNLITFSMMRAKSIHGLVRNLIISCVVPSLIISSLVFSELLPIAMILQWLVVAQMLLFIALCLCMDWGRTSNMFRESK